MKTQSIVSDEIWDIIRETQKNIRETQKNIRETQENIKDLSLSQKETGQSIKELSASQKELFAELSASQKETDKQIRKTDQQIQKIGGQFNERWGALVESLVEGKLVALFQSRGIGITQSHIRSTAQWEKSDDDIQEREFDIILANGSEVVTVEVKTALTPKDVSDFLETLKDFKNYFPRYKSETVYGAMAYLTSENKAHVLAEKEGLFIIRATGDSASIVNKQDFKPKVFS